MITLTEEETGLLQALGDSFRRSRLSRDESQSRSAARLGVSLPTYRKLEKGDPSAQIGVWICAIRLYGDPLALTELFPLSLFDSAQARQRASKRQRPS